MLRTYWHHADHLALAPPIPVPEAATASPVWHDLLNPTPEEDRSVEHQLGIVIPTREEMEDIELSARLYQESGAEFMTMTALTGLDGDDPVKTPVTFILKGSSLVTVRYAEPKPFDVFLLRAQRTNGGGVSCANGEMLMTGLIEALIDRLADALERLGNEIDAVSREVFRSKVSNVTKKTQDLRSLIEQLGRKADFLTAIRESLISISRLVAYHAALENPESRPSKEIRQRIKLLQRDATSLGDHANFLSGKINFLLDATLGLINLEQNQIIKIFSVAAVVFLPPTLVASIYGMNFDVMPELKWYLGYPFAILLMVLSAVMPYLYFKRRGWL
ncbi:magnesium transporter CorA family protein [Rhizobium leguminosarum]|uniref:magnesium transporter CorA family protein n=1 Tax=Rhizobium leguminosarum TaxID=384 RepID=UPI001441BC0A|nr:magnesium transporter CorA family protein [Rhizobium leguminosarum]NKL07038.1 magnesium transporter [Rhizobium leguminosarum bv. viciae]NKL88494.1 magnesium transporter [Rhizobium leguminosarum bv. viciae]NKL91457.1 magnesium transporter [Rhizobium leguminosarum bv. viciae]NKM91780.1 magnesium transporter [Rhizobium leguminosarum bv. viciae]